MRVVIPLSPEITSSLQKAFVEDKAARLVKDEASLRVEHAVESARKFVEEAIIKKVGNDPGLTVDRGSIELFLDGYASATYWTMGAK